LKSKRSFEGGSKWLAERKEFLWGKQNISEKKNIYISMYMFGVREARTLDLRITQKL
jgi:hypothetical protein